MAKAQTSIHFDLHQQKLPVVRKLVALSFVLDEDED
jgi:hypothetical protein